MTADQSNRDLFDPFDHGERIPNMLSTDDAVMLGQRQVEMISEASADMVDPDQAQVVDPDQARVVDPEQAQVVDPDGANVVITDRAEADDDHGQRIKSPQIVLIGAPGSGKSTVGAALAAQLGIGLCDVDRLIEQAEGRSITDIFAEDGEAGFRLLEQTHTVDVLRSTEPQVVALGGGAVMSPKIRAALTHHPIVWLEVSAATAVQRAGLNTSRPLLLGNVRGTLMKLLAERTPVYQNLATVTVSNNGDDPAAVVDQVVAALEEIGWTR